MGSHCEGLHACDLSPQYQGVYVVRALVRVDRFEVHDVADDVVLVLDAVAPEHVACRASDGQSLAWECRKIDTDIQ